MFSTKVVCPAERGEIMKLRRTPEAQRIILAGQLVNAYHDPRTPQNYRAIAEDLMRALAEDVSVSVRAAFSDLIKNSDSIPVALALKIAQDIDEVAVPVLECSELLTEENIIGIIAASVNSDKKLIAVASRRQVSERVSCALIETRNGAAAAALMRNPYAEISEDGYDIVVEAFGQNSSLIADMLSRERLPPKLVDSLAERVSSAVLAAVTSKAPELAEKLKSAVRRGGAVASLKTMGLQSAPLDYDRFMHKMNQLGVVDELVPLMALCLGKMNLFETCLAHSMGVSVANVKTLMSDASGKGFRAAYGKSGMPMRLLKVVGILVEIVRAGTPEGGDMLDKVDMSFANRLIEQLAERRDPEDPEHEENIQYVTNLIIRSCAIFNHVR